MGGGLCRSVDVDSSKITSLKYPEDDELSYHTSKRGIDGDEAGYRHCICFQSWNDVCRTSNTRDGIVHSGTRTLTNYFFDELKKADTDDRILKMFKPRPQSRNANSSAILFRIVKYLLTISDESMDTKQSVRSLGRTHARIGIGKYEFLAFNTAFINSLQLFSCIVDNPAALAAWRSLLTFVTDQMTFDKIVFREHCTPSGKDISDCSTHSATHSNRHDSHIKEVTIPIESVDQEIRQNFDVALNDGPTQITHVA